MMMSLAYYSQKFQKLWFPTLTMYPSTDLQHATSYPMAMKNGFLRTLGSAALSGNISKASTTSSNMSSTVEEHSAATNCYSVQKKLLQSGTTACHKDDSQTPPALTRLPNGGPVKTFPTPTPS